MKAGFRDAVSRARSSQRLVEVVAEALEPYGASEAAEDIVKAAMGQGAEALDLDDGAALRAFLHGPLAYALEARLGNGIANIVLDTVEQAFGMLPTPEESGVIRRRPPDAKRDATTDPAPPRKTILVVSEDRDLRDALLESVEGAGFAAVLSQDPKQAAHLCRNVQPSAVVFDDGRTAASRERLGVFQRALRGAAARVILLTARRGEPMPGVAVVAPRTVEREALVEAIKTVGDDEVATMTPVIRSLADNSAQGEARALLAEALDALVATSVRNRMITRALEHALLDEVPDDMLAFAAFAVGPLHQLVSRDLGEDTASALVSELTAIVQRTKATSGILRRTRPNPSMPAAPRVAPSAGPQVEALLVGKLCASFESALEPMGFVVSKVANGHAAIDWCSLHHPQVIVTSHDVPGLAVGQLAALLELTLGAEAPTLVYLSAGDDAAKGICSTLPHSIGSAQLAKAMRAALEAATKS